MHIPFLCEKKTNKSVCKCYFPAELKIFKGHNLHSFLSIDNLPNTTLTNDQLYEYFKNNSEIFLSVDFKQ